MECDTVLLCYSFWSSVKKKTSLVLSVLYTTREVLYRRAFLLPQTNETFTVANKQALAYGTPKLCPIPFGLQAFEETVYLLLRRRCRTHLPGRGRSAIKMADGLGDCTSLHKEEDEPSIFLLEACTS